MKVLITIQHPAHVHFFRPIIEKFDKNGDEVRVVGREKDIVEDLLKAYGLDHTLVAKKQNSLHGILLNQVKYEYKVLNSARSFKPDLLLAIGEPSVAHASYLFGGKSIIFTDTEHARLQNSITFPFADYVCTPESFSQNIGSKQLRYPGFHELSYLHPNNFSPNNSVVDKIGMEKGKTTIVLRLVSWEAVHDIGNNGLERVTRLVHGLEKTGAQVLITSESELPPSIDHSRVNLPVDEIHDLLYYSDLLLGESGTMAIESAVLGTPSIFVSSLSAGVIDEISDEYKLCRQIPPESEHTEVMSVVQDILNNPRSTWGERRRQLLNDKIDVSNYVFDLSQKIFREGVC